MNDDAKRYRIQHDSKEIIELCLNCTEEKCVATGCRIIAEYKRGRKLQKEDTLYAMAKRAGLPPHVMYKRVQKMGMKPEDAAALPYVSLKDQAKQAAEETGIGWQRIHQWMKKTGLGAMEAAQRIKARDESRRKDPTKGNERAKRLSIRAQAEGKGIPANIVYKRMHDGMTLEEALNKKYTPGVQGPVGKNIAARARANGIPVQAAYDRIRHGWDREEAVTVPYVKGQRRAQKGDKV